MPLDGLESVSEAIWRIPRHLRWDSYESVGEYMFALLTLVFGLGVSFVALIFMAIMIGTSLLGSSVPTEVFAFELPFIGALAPFAILTGVVASSIVSMGFAPFTDPREDLEDDAALAFMISVMALAALGVLFWMDPELAPQDQWVMSSVFAIAGAYVLTIGGWLWRAIMGWRG